MRCSAHTYRALRLPAALPALLRCLRCTVPSLRLGLRSRGRKAQRPWARELFTGFPVTGYFDGDDRISQVPGGPHYERALLSDPGGTSALGYCRALVLSSAKWTASTPATNTNFGAQSHGPLTHCLRFAEWIAPPPRKTRFRMAGQTFRAGLITRWVPAKGFRSSHPPFPSFTWRTHFTVSKSSGSPTIEFGNARLRKALWMVVLNAVRCNPWLRQYYENVFGPRANLARSPSSQLCESCSRRSGAWPLTGDPSFHTYLQPPRRPQQ